MNDELMIISVWRLGRCRGRYYDGCTGDRCGGTYLMMN